MAADAGLAVERTALSWRRTALSAVVAAIVLAHAAATTHTWLSAAPGFGAAIALVIVAATCYRRNQTLRARHRADIGVVTAWVAAAVAMVAGPALTIGVA